MINNQIVLPSNRKFGFFFTLVFMLIFIYMYYIENINLSIFFALLSSIFFLFSLFNPNKLRHLNLLWMKLGLFLGKVISPIVLGVIFFGIFTPVGILMRLLGRDELILKFRNKDSYWKKYSLTRKISDSFNNQF